MFTISNDDASCPSSVCAPEQVVYALVNVTNRAGPARFTVGGSGYSRSDRSDSKHTAILLPDIAQSR